MQDISSEYELLDSELSESELSESELSSPDVFCSTPLKKRQGSFSNFVVQTSSETKNEIDLLMAKYFFSSNIAFRSMENPYFTKMVEKLRPGYRPPNRKKLTGSLLDQVHEEVIETIKVNLCSNDAPLILMQYVWNNTQNYPIIAHSVHNGRNPILLSITEPKFSINEPKSDRITGEYCSSLAENAMEKIKMDYHKDVFAVCTDNENRMARVKEILKEKHPNLIIYGCATHYMNLLEKDVSPKIVLLKHIIEIQKYFQNHHLPRSWLEEKGGKILQIPNDTSWNSHIACVETFLSNYEIYMEIRGEHQEFPDNIGKLLDNCDIYYDYPYLLSDLKLFENALNKLQSDSTCLSDCMKIWIGLLRGRDLEPYRDSIKKRFKDATTPYHFLAYMTDPRYLDHPQVSQLTVQEKSIAEEFLSEYNLHFMAGLDLFRSKDPSIFPAYMFKYSYFSKITPDRWWRVLGQMQEKTKDQNRKLAPGLCKFFADLHCCPASSGSIERVFSTFGLSWNELHDTFGFVRAEKLAMVYKNLNVESLLSDVGEY